VNIQDILPTADRPTDMLEDIWKRQRELVEKYAEIEGFSLDDIPVNLDTKKGQNRVRDMMWRVVEELGEAANCLRNKPWKQNEVPTDKDHYFEELSDAMHFFVELLLVSGLTAEDAWNLYRRKFEVNQFRQRSGY